MKKQIFKHGFCTLLFIALFACSDNQEEGASTPSTNPPTQQFIVNMTVSDVGEETGIFGCHKLPRAGEQFYRNAHSLDNEAFFSVLGNNYNMDGTYPTNLGDDFARPGFEVDRNNTAITFVLADDTNANAEIIVNQTFERESRGIVSFSCGDSAIEITQFDFTFRELEPNSEVLGPFAEISYYQEEFVSIRVGNFFISIDGTDTDMTTFRNLASQTQNPIKIKIIETIIVEDKQRTTYQPGL